jgi:hypothetical protein
MSEVASGSWSTEPMEPGVKDLHVANVSESPTRAEALAFSDSAPTTQMRAV